MMEYGSWRTTTVQQDIMKLAIWKRKRSKAHTVNRYSDSIVYMKNFHGIVMEMQAHL